MVPLKKNKKNTNISISQYLL